MHSRVAQGALTGAAAGAGGLLARTLIESKQGKIFYISVISGSILSAYAVSTLYEFFNKDRSPLEEKLGPLGNSLVNTGLLGLGGLGAGIVATTNLRLYFNVPKDSIPLLIVGCAAIGGGAIGVGIDLLNAETEKPVQY